MNIGIFDKIEIRDIIHIVNKLYGTDCEKLSDSEVLVRTGGDACLITSDFKKCSENDIILVNADKKNDLSPLSESKAKIVTYGLNHKTCVTASSINEAEVKSIQFCIQRSIPTSSGKSFEPQEFPVNIESNADVCGALAGVTAALICDFDIEILKEFIV